MFHALFRGMVLFAFCACTFPIQAQINPLAEKTPDSIRGTVVNSVTHEPIGHALVYSPDNRFAAFTDSHGNFEFKLPAVTPSLFGGLSPAGARPYQLMARKPGFLNDDSQSTTLEPNQSEVTLYLTPEALIVGRVNLATPDSSQRINVQLYRRQIQDGRSHWIPASGTQTHSNGEFRFADLPAGTYKVFTLELLDRDPLTFDPRGQLYGYPPVFFPSTPSFASAGTIQLAAGQTFQVSLSPQRREYYPVELAVRNVAQGASVGIDVSLAGQAGPGYSLGYNSDQQKIIGSLPNGTYTVDVASYAQPSTSGSLSISVNGGPVIGPSLMLLPESSIEVKVSEEFAPAQANKASSQDMTIDRSSDGFGRTLSFQINLEPAGELGGGRSASIRPPTGPDDTSLVIADVLPGRYWVDVVPFRGYATSVSSGGVDLLHQPLVVPPGSSSPPIEVTLRDDGAQIDVAVESAGTADTSLSSASTQKPAFLYLVPLPSTPAKFQQMQTTVGSTFSFQQVPPGDYRIFVFDRQQTQLEFTNEEAMRKYESQGQLLRLLPNQKENVRLHVISGSN